MAFLDNLQYQVENFALYFQGGVRRSVLIFAGICLVLLAPVYFFGQIVANTWHALPANPNRFNSQNILVPKSIVQSKVQIDRSNSTELENGELVLYTFVDNKANQTIGYFPYIYRLQILDSAGAVIKESVERTYLLPGEVRYIVANTNDPNAKEIRVTEEPGTQPILYNPVSNQLSKLPNIEVRDPQVTEIPGTSQLRLRAIFKNLDRVFVGEFNVVMLIRDTQGSVRGIKDFTFTGFIPGSEREVNLTYPKPKDRVAASLDVRWSVNYLDPANIKLD